MTLKLPFSPNPVSVAVASARWGLCSALLWPLSLIAQPGPYAAGDDGDMFASSIQAHERGTATLDWVPRQQLTEAQQLLCRAGCEGAYIAPERADADVRVAPAEAPVRASADSSRWLQDGRAELSGNVSVVQGYRSLSADRAVYDQRQQTAQIEGHVVVREPGVAVFADRLALDEGRGSATLDNAAFVMHDAHLRGRAELLGQQRSGPANAAVYSLVDGSFTMCAPDDNAWLVRGDQIDIDTASGQGYARHMRLELADVPVFYAPYFRFPASDKRMTGLLFPTVGLDNRNGFEYAQPVYLNLAPNYDLTLTPRWMEHRGVSLAGEARHLSPLFHTRVGAAYLSDDQGGNNEALQDRADAGEIEQDAVTPYRGRDRWLLDVQQAGGAGRAWHTRIDYAEVSDVDYLRDLNTGSLETSARTHLLQSGSAGYGWQNWQLGVKAEAYQSVSIYGEEPYRQLPRVDLNGQYRWGATELILQHQYTQFDHSETYWRDDDPTPSDARIVGDRLRTDYRLDWRAETLWGYIRPAVMLKHLQYDLDPAALKDGANPRPSLTGGQVSLDAGLLFERQDALWGRAYLQTFEPRLFYFNSPEQDHSELYQISSAGRSVAFDTSEIRFSYDQLFRESRFNGGDRIDDADQLSVGLTTRFFESASGVQRLKLSLGQIFYASDRRVTLNGESQSSPRSEIAGQVAAQIGDHWRYALDIAYSQDDGRPSQGSTSLRYQTPAGQIINLGYRYRRGVTTQDEQSGELYDTSVNQTDIGVALPIAEDWNLVARSFYDFALDREIDTFAGVEYNSCCYRMRFVARRWTDSRDLGSLGPSDLDLDRGIFFEFQLKGLGSLGRRLDQLLTEGIIGFDQRPQYEP